MQTLRYAVLLVAAALLLSFGAAIAGRAVQMVRITQDETRLRREVALVQERNAALRAQKEFYNSEAYVQRVAREELGLVKPGEIAVIVVNRPKAEAPPAPLPPAVAPAPRGLLDRWGDALLGH
ncbi:MAG: septum formation initiator family protein [Chloroflexi bacterium]|nr:septum formation initiator family protein [Chloroflexota bacterium]